jgi:hypothetical protein
MKFRGPVSRDLDDWYTTGNVKTNLDEAQRLLNSPRNFTAIIAELTHGKPSFVFPKHPKLRGNAFESKLRQGYLDAIELALDHYDVPVPIRTWWETRDGINDFDTKITDHVDHVEVTILVPTAILDANEQPGLANAKKLGLT